MSDEQEGAKKQGGSGWRALSGLADLVEVVVLIGRGIWAVIAAIASLAD